MVSQLFAGNKSELIKLLKQKDKEFLIKYLKDILPLQQWLVKSKMSQSVLTSEDDGLSVVSKIVVSRSENDSLTFEVNKQCFRQFGVHEPMKENVIVFQLRDDRIFESHTSVNSNRHGYRP